MKARFLTENMTETSVTNVLDFRKSVQTNWDLPYQLPVCTEPQIKAIIEHYADARPLKGALPVDSTNILQKKMLRTTTQNVVSPFCISK